MDYESGGFCRDPDGIIVAHHASMVIDASRIFRCAHTYVAVKQWNRLMLVCASCEHKTEMLPLRNRRAHQPAERVEIGSSRARTAGRRMGRR